MLLMQPSRFKFIKIYPLTVEATKLLTQPSKLYCQRSSISKSKFFRLCYQTLTTYHPDVFTLMLSLLEGRADIAWEPSNYKMLFPPPPPSRNKVSLTSPPTFSLCFYSFFILPISLSQLQSVKLIL
jgi:hypothetical protein